MYCNGQISIFRPEWRRYLFEIILWLWLWSPLLFMMNGPNFRKSTKIVLFSVKMNHISEKSHMKKCLRTCYFLGGQKFIFVIVFTKLAIKQKTLFIRYLLIQIRKEKKLVFSSVEIRSSKCKWLLIGISLNLGIL